MFKFRVFLCKRCPDLNIILDSHTIYEVFYLSIDDPRNGSNQEKTVEIKDSLKWFYNENISCILKKVLDLYMVGSP